MKPFFTAFITLLSLTIVIQTSAQVEVNWLHNIKAERYSQVMDFIHSDSSIYLSHCSKGAIDNEDYGTIISKDDTQSSLIKLDEKGKVIWKNSVISKATRITSIIKTAAGNIVAIGYSEGETTFISAKQKLTIKKSQDCFMFISHFSPEGKLIDIKTIEQKKGRRSLFPTAASINSSGELFISLNFYSELSSQGKVIENTAMDAEYSAVLKFSKKRDFIKIVKQWDLIGTKAKVDIKIDHKDNLIISGYSRGSVHLSDDVILKCSEGNIYEANTSYSFVAKYSPEIKLLWHQKIGGRNDQIISGLVISTKNEIYLCGTYTFECIFSNDVPDNNTEYIRKFESSIFYAKLNADGVLSFVKYYRSNGGNSCRSGSLAIDENDYIHMTGSYNGKLDFNSFEPIRIGEILKDPHIIRKNWRVNTRGNSAWFYSVWKDDINLYSNNLYDLNGYPDGQFVRKIIAYNETVLMGGFYHIGKPSLITSSKNLELEDSSSDSAMYSVFVSSVLPELAFPTYTRTETIDTNIYETTAEVKSTKMERFNQQKVERDIISLDSSSLPPHSNFKVNIFPNPTADYLNIKFNHFDAFADLRLVSETGAIIYSQSISQISIGETIQLNMSSLTSGTYYLVVSSINFSKSYPIIKVS